MRWLLLLCAVSAAGCARKEQKVSDAERLQIRLGGAFPTDAVGGCYAMDKPKRWRGFFRYDFERSLFCADRQCSDTLGGQMWLSGKAAGLWPNPKTDQGSLYEIEFIGRRTAVRGYHGHQSQYPYEVVVDRLISMKRIEAPPKT